MITKLEILELACECADGVNDKGLVFEDTGLHKFAERLLAHFSLVVYNEPVAILHRERKEIYTPKLTIHEKADITFLWEDKDDIESNPRYLALKDGEYLLYTTPHNDNLMFEDLIATAKNAGHELLNERDNWFSKLTRLVSISPSYNSDRLKNE